MIVNLLTDAPKHNHALMKILTYHKELGDDVYLNFPLMPADRTYVSLLYDFSPLSLEWLGNTRYLELSGTTWVGGPATFRTSNGRCWTCGGHSILPSFAEDCRPDLDLYHLDYSLGYSFRPCFRNCSFCKVCHMPYPDTQHHSIWEFHDSSRSKICLLNNNTFFDKQWKETFEEIWDANLTVIDENGYDVRLLDDEKAEALKRTKFEGKLHFAWDRMQDESAIIKGLKLLKKYHIRGSFYVLINYDTTEAEDIHRCQVLKDYGFDFYIMPYGHTWQGMMFKRFVDTFMWRKYKTIAEAWKNYEPRKKVVEAYK